MQFRETHPTVTEIVHVGSNSKAAGYANIAREPENLASRQELVLFGICRVRFDLHRKLPCQGKDPLQACRRIERYQGKKEIGETMMSRQYLINSSPVEPVRPALLTRQE